MLYICTAIGAVKVSYFSCSIKKNKNKNYWKFYSIKSTAICLIHCATLTIFNASCLPEKVRSKILLRVHFTNTSCPNHLYHAVFMNGITCICG